MAFINKDFFFHIASKAVGKLYSSKEDGVSFWRVLYPDRSNPKRIYMFDMLDPKIKDKLKKMSFNSVMTILSDPESVPPFKMLEAPIKECKNPSSLAEQLSMFAISAALPYCVRDSGEPELTDFAVPTEEPKRTLVKFILKMLYGEIRDNKIYLREFYKPIYEVLYKYAVEVNNLFITKTLEHNQIHLDVADDLEKAVYKIFMVMFLQNFVRMARMCSAIQIRIYAPSVEEFKELTKDIAEGAEIFGFTGSEEIPDDLEYALLMTGDEAKEFLDKVKAEQGESGEELPAELEDVVKFSRKSDKVS